MHMLVSPCIAAGFQQSEIDMLKIWYSAYPKEPGVDCGNLAMNRKVCSHFFVSTQTETT